MHKNSSLAYNNLEWNKLKAIDRKQTEDSRKFSVCKKNKSRQESNSQAVSTQARVLPLGQMLLEIECIITQVTFSRANSVRSYSGGFKSSSRLQHPCLSKVNNLIWLTGSLCLSSFQNTKWASSAEEMSRICCFIRTIAFTFPLKPFIHVEQNYYLFIPCSSM